MTERTTGRRITGASLIRRLALVAAGCAAIRLCADRLTPGELPSLPDSLARAVLALELPGAEPGLPDPLTLLLSAELTGSPATSTDSPQEEADPPVQTAPDVPGSEPGVSDPPTDGPADVSDPQTPDGDTDGPTAPADDPGEGDRTDAGTGADTLTEPEKPLEAAIETTITGKTGGYLHAGGLYIKNKTGYDIDVEGLLSKPLEFSAPEAAVLIIHTHGSEAYNPTEADPYVPSDPSRTEDRTHNVVRVGDELASVLEERGIRVIHDRELYDYPSYTGSYNRSLESIKAHLKEDPDIKVVIDLHRDALAGDNGEIYKVSAQLPDGPSAQVMLICGSNYSGLNHPDWQENLSFALKLQSTMDATYPTLARPLKISEYRYNQHATTGSLIAEIGTNGNTLREAINAARHFGECLAEVLTDG